MRTEHIRLRAGMYIGRLSDGSDPRDGIYTLLREMINNSVDEFLAGYGNTIAIEFDKTKASIRDYGRGCPLEMVTMEMPKHPNKKTEPISKTIGITGIGLNVTNALSSVFYIASFRNGVKSWDRYSKGILMENGKDSTDEPDGTLVQFTPDTEVFENYFFREGHMKEMVKLFSYMHKDLTLILNGVVYKSDGGLLDLVAEKISAKPLYAPIHLEGEDIEIVLTHISGDETTILSYVNGHPTLDGGTHTRAFSRALTAAFSNLSMKHITKKNCLHGVFAAIRVNVRYPYFVTATKAELDTTFMYQDCYPESDVKEPVTVESYVSGYIQKNLMPYLQQHGDVAEIIKRKVESD